MVCKAEYEEMMSLKLDGLLASDEEASFEAHLAECGDCAPVWEAFRKADALLWASAREPLPLPEGFHTRVMAQVATAQVSRPVVSAVPDILLAPNPRSVLLGLPVYSLDAPEQWQHALARYLRVAAAVSLSLLGTVGLLLALVMSNTLTVGEPFSGFVEMVRTVINSAATWVRSLPIGMGPETLTVGGLLLGTLLLVGWQVVTNYHRRIFEQPGGIGFAEAAA